MQLWIEYSRFACRVEKSDSGSKNDEEDDENENGMKLKGEKLRSIRTPPLCVFTLVLFNSRSEKK